VNIALLNKSY